MRPRASKLVALLLFGALLLLTAYIYSPWHRHDPFSNQTCSLCAFAHCLGLQAAAHFVVDPPAALLWSLPDGGILRPIAAARDHRSGRAPPALS